jgi:uncharacterized lipoprotein
MRTTRIVAAVYVLLVLTGCGKDDETSMDNNDAVERDAAPGRLSEVSPPIVPPEESHQTQKPSATADKPPNE